MKKKLKAKNIKTLTPFVYVPLKEKDFDLVMESIMELLIYEDLQEVQGVLSSYIKDTKPKSLARKARVEHQELLKLIDLNNKFDPKLSTFAALLNGLRKIKESSKTQ